MVICTKQTYLAYYANKYNSILRNQHKAINTCDADQ